MSIRQSHNFRNPIRISFLGTAFFLVLLLFYCLYYFFGYGQVLFSITCRWEFLIPPVALGLLFLLNRWFGDLMLLDKYERAVNRFIFPPLFLLSYSFVFFSTSSVNIDTVLVDYIPIAFDFFLYPSLALLFLYLLFSTKDDEHCPSIMLTLGIILSALSIFYASKIIFVTLLIPVLLYRLNSLSWRNIFALLFGLVLVPLFVLPYLYYQQGEALWGMIKLWLISFTNVPSFFELNPNLSLTVLLTALIGQANYSFKTAQLSTKQRSYLSSFCLMMWFSLLYLAFGLHYDVFVISLFLFTSCMLFSRAVVSLDKKFYYAVMIAYVILIFLSLFYQLNRLLL